MTVMRTRVAGWLLRITTDEGHSISRFVPEDDAPPVPQEMRHIYLQELVFLRQVGDALIWVEANPLLHGKHFMRRLALHLRWGGRTSRPLPLPMVTEPDPRYDFALWFRGCRIVSTGQFDNGCVEIEFITQGGERSVDCVPVSEVTIRPFRK